LFLLWVPRRRRELALNFTHDASQTLRILPSSFVANFFPFPEWICQTFLCFGRIGIIFLPTYFPSHPSNVLPKSSPCSTLRPRPYQLCTPWRRWIFPKVQRGLFKTVVYVLCSRSRDKKRAYVVLVIKPELLRRETPTESPRNLSPVDAFSLQFTPTLHSAKVMILIPFDFAFPTVLSSALRYPLLELYVTHLCAFLRAPAFAPIRSVRLTFRLSQLYSGCGYCLLLNDVLMVYYLVPDSPRFFYRLKSCWTRISLNKASFFSLR